MALQITIMFFAAAITNNILLTNFVGMCPFLAISKQMKAATGLGVAVIFVTGFTGTLNWLIFNKLLVQLELESCQFIVFIRDIIYSISATYHRL